VGLFGEDGDPILIPVEGIAWTSEDDSVVAGDKGDRFAESEGSHGKVVLIKSCGERLKRIVVCKWVCGDVDVTVFLETLGVWRGGN